LLVDNQPIDEDHPMRGLSVCATSLVESDGNRQLSFGGDHIQEELDHTIDGLRNRFGNACIQRGIELMDESLRGREIKDEHTVHPVGYLHR
jgi:DNA polymerase-4